MLAQSLEKSPYDHHFPAVYATAATGLRDRGYQLTGRACYNRVTRFSLQRQDRHHENRTS